MTENEKIDSKLDLIADLIGNDEHKKANAMLAKLGGRNKGLPDTVPPLSRAKFFELSGLCAFELERYERAVEAFTAVIPLEEAGGEPATGMGYSHANLAKALAACARFEEAAAEMTRAGEFLEQGGTDEESIGMIWFRYGQALYKAERFGDAAGAFQSAARLIEKAQSHPQIRSVVWLFAGKALVPVAKLHALFDQVNSTVTTLRSNGLDTADSLEKLKPNTGKSAAINETAIDAFARSLAAACEMDRFTETLLFASLDLALFLQSLTRHYDAIPHFRIAIGHAASAKSSPRYTGKIRAQLAESLDAVGDKKGAREERLAALKLFTEAGDEKLAAGMKALLEGRRPDSGQRPSRKTRKGSGQNRKPADDKGAAAKGKKTGKAGTGGKPARKTGPAGKDPGKQAKQGKGRGKKK
jgi:tetratricopeptide (TPR) repeat protein